MATKCAICTEAVSQEVKNQCCCEYCNNIICRKCSQLTASEIKVIDLSQRRMIFLCPECRPHFPDLIQTKNVIKREMDQQIFIMKKEFSSQLMDIMNKLGEIQAENKILHNIIEENTSKSKRVNSALETLTRDLKTKLDSTEKEVKSSYSGESRKSNNTSSPQNKLSINIAPNLQPGIAANKNKISKEYNQTTYETLRQTQRDVMDRLITLGDPEAPIASHSGGASSEIAENNHNADGFKQVKRKRRMGRVGTADSSPSIEPDDCFEGSAVMKKKKIWVFLKKVKDNAAPEKIQRYLTKALKAVPDDVEVKKVETYYQVKDNNCYLIGVDPKYQQNVYDDSLWPKGVVYQRFNFVKGQKFLDSPSLNTNKQITQKQVQKPDSFLEILNN